MSFTPADGEQDAPAAAGTGAPVMESCVPWFPPDVRKSFARMQRALRRRRFSQVDYLSRTFQKRFPAYAGYYQDTEAHALRLRGRRDQALDLFLRADAFFKGRNPATLEGLVSCLADGDTLEEAEAYAARGLRSFPGDPALEKLRCRILLAQGRAGEALPPLRALCARAPDASLLRQLGECCFQLGLHKECLEAYTRAEQEGEGALNTACDKIFMAHYMPECNREELRNLIREWRDTYCAPLPPTPPACLRRDPAAEKRLRVGFLSPGFSMHPVGWMTAHALWFLGRLPEYELYFYSLKKGPNKDDPIRDLFRAAAAKWVNAENWDAARLYAAALDDKLDIAVDLAGHGEGCVLPLFARRLAPVQVKWVGALFNTTGVPEMDYLLTDRFETPDGSDAWYAEKLVRLPHSYISYELNDCGDTERLADSRSGAPRIRFASFNNFYKLNPAIAEVWAEILRRVPDSTLLLKTHQLGHEGARNTARALFARHGIAPERLECEGPSPYKQLMRTYRKVDIALDTWPYTGGVTTLEALWMGVPVVTTPGPSFAGRHALSHLCNAGLESLVAKDFDEYVKIAVTLAGDRRLLADLRVLLPYSLATSPIVRPHQLAADLHTAFRAMWERHCAGLPPVAMRFEQPSEIPDAFKPFIPDMLKKSDSTSSKASSFSSLSR